LADWLSISDCFLSLSTFEGFGLSIGEAMAAGVPTVATPAGIAPGLATTLPTDSTAEEWAAAVVTAKPIVTPAEILDRFSVQRMVDAWASVIKGLQ
jgi:glycosyltransferase involved in cell wall biosynthesis